MRSSQHQNTASSSVAYNCGGFYYPAPNKTLTFAQGGTGAKEYKSGQNCLWTIYGDGEPPCVPAVTCSSVDLRADKCDTEFVRVSDGFGGGITACGRDNKFGTGRFYSASQSGRDLYIEFKSHSDKQGGAEPGDEPKGSGFHCEVSCDAQGRKSEPLPDDEEGGRREGRCVCGIGPTKDDGTRIVNGEDADEYEFPWLAAVVKADTRKMICGASILNSRYILTAAHCFGTGKIKPQEYEVLLHAHLLSIVLLDGFNKTAAAGGKGSIKYRGWDKPLKTDEDERSLRFPIDEIIIHSEYKRNYDYDAALIRIKGSIPMVTGEAQALVPICLPKPFDYGNSWADMNATVAGWGVGQFDAGATTRLLQKLTVPVINMAKCKEVMPKSKNMTPRMMCAGYIEGGKDSCQGDSGGPLIVKQNKSQFKQIGVVSFGEKCAQKNRPGIYTNINEVLQWINYHANYDKPVWCLDEL